MGKDWDQHVLEAEELARTDGFQRLRDDIIGLADAGPEDVVVDVGAGTGLLTLGLAHHVESVCAIDISSAMLDYLAEQAADAGLANIRTVTANAIRLPLADASATLVVSNYCFHHLSDDDKEQAIREVFRVLRPGGRVVIGDMMFRVQVGDRRNRHVIVSKVRALLRRGPAGVLRLLKNAARLLAGQWEQPADSAWWERAMRRAGFGEIKIQLLEHEGGLITARRSLRSTRQRRRLRAPRSAARMGTP